MKKQEPPKYLEEKIEEQDEQKLDPDSKNIS
jgi:hypothetical protein